MHFRRHLLIPLATVVVCGLTAAQARGAEGPLVVEVSGPADELPADSVRDAISHELGAPEASAQEPGARGTLLVKLGEGGACSMVFISNDGHSIERTVELSADRERALTTIALLAGNLVRNEAQGLVRPRAEPAPAAAAPPPAPTESPQPARVAAAPPVVAQWAGVFGVWDYPVVSGTDVCGHASQTDKTFVCVIQDGAYAGGQYQGDPIPEGQGDEIASGVVPGTKRLLLSYERRMSETFSLGVRAGVAFGLAPKVSDDSTTLRTLHAELRAGFWPMGTPFSTPGVRPTLFVAAGMGPVDAKVETTVREAPYCGAAGCSVINENGQVIQVNPQQQNLDAWRRSSAPFMGVGVGAVFPFSSSSGLQANLRVSWFVLDSLTAITPEVGYVIGF